MNLGNRTGKMVELEPIETRGGVELQPWEPERPTAPEPDQILAPGDRITVPLPAYVRFTSDARADA